jgi:hypothetical protein
LPRNDIPISNNYSVLCSIPSDFHIVIYYIDVNKCKIILRRLDEIYGWNFDVKIKIEDEIINIGISDKNYLIIEIDTETKLIKENINNNQLIPKVIIQTSKDNKCRNLLHYNSIMTFLELNPEYEYRFFDNTSCREFIKNNFDNSVLIAYDSLIPGAYKADLFRYCYLQINGGCYFDCKMILRIPLRKIINYNDTFIICEDYKGYSGTNKQLYNAVILTINNKLGNVIIGCVDNINKKLYNGTLNITGPGLLYKYFFNLTDNIKLKHNILNNYSFNNNLSYLNYVILFNNSIIITKQFKDYYVNYLDINHYTVYYKKKEVYIDFLYEFTFNYNTTKIYTINKPLVEKLKVTHDSKNIIFSFSRPSRNIYPIWIINDKNITFNFTLKIGTKQMQIDIDTINNTNLSEITNTNLNTKKNIFIDTQINNSINNSTNNSTNKSIDNNETKAQISNVKTIKKKKFRLTEFEKEQHAMLYYLENYKEINKKKIEMVRKDNLRARSIIKKI